MAKTEYITIKDSKNVVDSRSQLPRYDILTYPINTIRFTDPIIEYTLTEKDVGRFDLFILETYGEVDFYRKIILWLNNIPILDESHIGKKINIFSKLDLDNFLISNIV